MVARKLGVADFNKWVTKEIEGYKVGDEIPEYRIVRGQIKAWNPYRGWIDTVIGNPEIQEMLSSRPIGQPIGELESVIERSDSFVHIPFHPETERQLMDASEVPMKPTLQVSVAATKGILDRVRKIVLDWCLDLEEKGILGEGMTFSAKEKRSASKANYHVHYHGPVTTSQVQQGTTDSSQTISTKNDLGGVASLVTELRSRIAELRLTTDVQKQMLAELNTIDAQLGAPQPKSTVIKECLGSVRNILEGCAGGILASGLLQTLASVLPK